MAIRIGTSGWSYDHWQGVVYPRGPSSPRRLDAYTAPFATVEVNDGRARAVRNAESLRALIGSARPDPWERPL